jgi:hypothetical protein
VILKRKKNQTLHFARYGFENLKFEILKNFSTFAPFITDMWAGGVKLW